MADEPEQSSRLLQPIAEGEEVTICYTDVLQPTHLRRAALEERFCFACACPRCQAGGAAGGALIKSTFSMRS